MPTERGILPTAPLGRYAQVGTSPSNHNPLNDQIHHLLRPTTTREVYLSKDLLKASC